MANGVSGQYGTLKIGSSEILEVYKWSFSRKAAVHTRSTNADSGYKCAVAGTKSGSGSIAGNYDPADPVDDHFEEGDSITALLYTTAAKYFSVPMMIESLDYEVDIDEGAIVGWEAAFQTNGAWDTTNIKS